jgi:Arc/MetJ-type ribon-helix-helix transcriptional regulator
MQPTISPENEQFVQQEIANGTFYDRGEALNAGLELLRQRKELRARLDRSRRQLDSGAYTDYDGPGLRELFNDLKRRVEAKAKAPAE